MVEIPSSLTVDQIAVGDRLPQLRVPITPTTITLGASASRDWQPQHHDHEWAQKVGLRGIIMNTPNQAGWISRYITQWAGPKARLGRMRFRMKSSICPGDVMILNGTVMRILTDDSACAWVDIIVESTIGDTLATGTTVTFAVPSSKDDNPWDRRPNRWLIAQVPPLDSAA